MIHVWVGEKKCFKIDKSNKAQTVESVYEQIRLHVALRISDEENKKIGYEPYGSRLEHRLPIYAHRNVVRELVVPVHSVRWVEDTDNVWAGEWDKT